jgi:hypothetical protein
MHTPPLFLKAGASREQFSPLLNSGNIAPPPSSSTGTAPSTRSHNIEVWFSFGHTYTPWLVLTFLQRYWYLPIFIYWVKAPDKTKTIIGDYLCFLNIFYVSTCILYMSNIVRHNKVWNPLSSFSWIAFTRNIRRECECEREYERGRRLQERKPIQPTHYMC